MHHYPRDLRNNAAWGRTSWPRFSSRVGGGALRAAPGQQLTKIYTHSTRIVLAGTFGRVYKTHISKGEGMGKTVSSKEAITSIEADGWREVGQDGSHKQFKHPTKPGKVTIPHPRKELAIGTLKSIERQSGVRLR
jgi:predicted RNA binding protein YcfA (HicA-like mRNA interferase family)